MKRGGPFIALATLAIVALISFSTLVTFLVDWLWFDSLGFGGVFATVWRTKLIIFALAAAASFVLLLANSLIATRAGVPRVRRLHLIRTNGGFEVPPEVFDVAQIRWPWRGLVAALAALLGTVVGYTQAGNWEMFLKWRYAVPFNRADPLFGHDLAFYVFTLPVYAAGRDWALLMLFLGAAVAGGLYWVRGAIDVDEGFPRLAPAVVRHASILLALFFLVKAADYLLQRYDLLFNDNGVVVGAAYTDVHLRLPLLSVLAAAALIAAGLCIANVRSLGVRLPTAAVVLLFGSVLLGGIAPNVFEAYRVKPDELRLESPYITQSIAYTRFGFALDRFTSKPFPAEGKLAPEVLAANDTTIQNIRWWDPRPLLDTYRQLQEIRLYYDFNDVDVDRYTLDGKYQEVMLAARELNQARLPADAQTWINQHFKFTHGIGLTMSPVNRFDSEGLPIFYVKDIPPASLAGLPIERPEVYFGEQTRTYLVVGGATKEFDYAKGQDNVYTSYTGHDGVVLDALWRRALFAWYFGDVNLLISSNVTPASRLLLRRTIQERINRIAPFLRLDHDPYLVVNGGRLVWVQDAYTTTDAIPYAQLNRHAGINYIRNALKITIDAYDGAPTFYVSDADDPLVRTYQRIFPSLFQPLSALPAGLRQHLRYPEDLFLVQASTYGTFHMTDPEVFYNKEDLWSFPQESYSGQPVTMQPYYTIMRLPGETQAEFILMLPMVPNKRDNMIAWLAARCDGDHYGTLIEYAFPKEKLIFGPAQIEARIDQDTTISQQLSLWNQMGSRVIRGNLLVIPIDDALLYVEPLYLSAQQRELPELKRVIASAGDHVVMNQAVEPLLAALFPGAGAASTVQAIPSRAPPSAPQPPPGALSSPALTHYRHALDALRNGDWQTFGNEMDALQKALEAQ